MGIWGGEAPVQVPANPPGKSPGGCDVSCQQPHQQPLVEPEQSGLVTEQPLVHEVHGPALSGMPPEMY